MASVSPHTDLAFPPSPAAADRVDSSMRSAGRPGECGNRARRVGGWLAGSTKSDLRTGLKKRAAAGEKKVAANGPSEQGEKEATQPAASERRAGSKEFNLVTTTRRG